MASQPSPEGRGGLRERSERLVELDRAAEELKIVADYYAGRRRIGDLRREVIELYRRELVERGVVPDEIEEIVYEDGDGRYYVKGSKIVFNVYAHGGEVYLIEAKPRADVEDVEWLYKRGEIYEKITGRKPHKLILVAVLVDADAHERARELGVEVIYGSLVR